MHAEALKALGESLADRVEKSARQEHYSNESFERIASEALEASKVQLSFDSRAIMDFIWKTPTRQSQQWFSDIPVVLAERRNFRIELLCWFSATTSIHSHAFCGAFRVMQGSSLHTKFLFEADHWISEQLGVGKLECVESEYLQVGDTRVIRPGKTGLLHSLYHLDSPSLTLVIRTHGTPSAKPQLGFYHPGLALDFQGLSKDEEVNYLTRLLTTMFRRDPKLAASLFLESIGKLDSARLARICLGFSKQIIARSIREPVRLEITNHHGVRIANLIDEALEKQQVEQQLITARNATDDPELRFFLALLLNARNRTAIFQLIRTRFPDREPEAMCSEWLVRLANLKSGAETFMQEVAQRANEPGFRLGLTIHSKLPKEYAYEGIKKLLKTSIVQKMGDSSEGAGGTELKTISALAPLFAED